MEPVVTKWQYKTMAIDLEDCTVHNGDIEGWISFEDLGHTQWELCQIAGVEESSRFSRAIFRRQVEQEQETTGPFSVYTNEYGKRFIRYDAGEGERFSQMMPRPILFLVERLVEWLNRLWAERKGES